MVCGVDLEEETMGTTIRGLVIRQLLLRYKADRFAHAHSLTIKGNVEALIMDGIRKIEGARAFNRGIERDRCPHAPGSASFKSGSKGGSIRKPSSRKGLSMSATRSVWRRRADERRMGALGSGLGT